MGEPNKITGEATLHVHYNTICESEAGGDDKPSHPVVICAENSDVTFPEKPLQITTSKAPKLKDNKALCEFVQTARTGLSSLIAGLNKERDKLDKELGSPRTLEYNPQKAKKEKQIKELEGKIKDLQTVLNPSYKSDSMDPTSEEENIDKDKSYIEFVVSKPKKDVYRIPMKSFWNPESVCGKADKK